ncbi:DNA/RNA helicase DEAD/DEAH box type N-terminal [Penicillium brevicompactum]|uniref:DNA/RNA helicase DEAD/DEAH box type N-terminal n=1 Tax=Penicillium brevicompactum TaxID=5074 RepID=A0A9W9RD17_PENBR|nr:DNA/RNA helicase DEAD/DEAH box type N-terminal [Penicillium brevicompactum]KAJ5335326.1 DNA/RNA helicase DEAD/DEAH box type N-terminal [Penicillium brevicompactum]KAJ5336983.1 DNA/RNA helicase DEAD/DEAH box type N-terminal [Penicillium brevicompactum]KAJ5357993.1 DNA/RNA helicase DEAD/DEAH box type N-terminal [Penicillium brevicompactum]
MSDTNAPKGLSAKIQNKRKRQAEDAAPQQEKTEAAGTPAEGTTKKKQKKNKNKKKQADDGEQSSRKDGIDESIGKMDGRLLGDYFAQKAKRHEKELSAVELSDLSIPDSAFLDTSSFTSTRKLEQLPEFLKTFSPKGADLSKASEKNGTPHTLVISGAALRAADVVRALRPFSTKETIVGKLFAKHIKLEEAKQFLTRARSGIGAGTPTRISDLIESGTLKLDELERIVIDGSHIDQKQRGIFDMKETHMPLLKLLTRPELRDRLGSKKGVKILVF